MSEDELLDERAKQFSIKDLEAKMTPEQRAKLAAYDAEFEAGAPARAAALDKQRKQTAAVEAVKLGKARQEIEAMNIRNLTCKEIAEAVLKSDPLTAESILDKYIKNETAFQKVVPLDHLSSLLNQLSNRPEDMVIMHQPEVTNIRLSTVYLDTNLETGPAKVAVMVTVDSTYNPIEPTVSFEITDLIKTTAPAEDVTLAQIDKPQAPEKTGGIFSQLKNLFRKK